MAIPLILTLWTAKSLAADRNTDPVFVHAMLTQCYNGGDALIKYNQKQHGWSYNDAKSIAEVFCGRLLINAQENGIGVILLNMYESSRTNS